MDNDNQCEASSAMAFQIGSILVVVVLPILIVVLVFFT